MSKIEAHQIKLNKEYFEMDDVVATLQDIFQLQAQMKQLAFRVEVDRQVPRYLFGDRGKLQQVVINLLSNAFKFTTAGEIHLKFWSDNVLPQDTRDTSPLRLYCQVRDTGIGIAPEELELLFAPFIQTSAGKQVQEGTGLGLSISKHFVELMAGEIQVTSQVSQGSCFQFFVTLHTASQCRNDISPETTAAIAPLSEKKRILIVNSSTDGSPSWHDFSRDKIDIKQATNRDAVVSLICHWQPHLVVIDRDANKIDIATLLLEIPTKIHVSPYVIMASQNPLSTIEQDHLRILGCDGFVTNSSVDPKILPVLMKYLGVEYTSVEYTSIEAHQHNHRSLGDGRAQAPAISQASYINSVLSQTDASWRQRLRIAAIAARETTIRQLLTEITETYPALSQHLHHYLNNLAFDTIVKLIDDIEES
ncbi:sensor histidine kinase [[Limnothrix rosea] IAM M-220]|uniref:sensor histidine kinase n=1 Tax=[Limnothrix rosea] IAM M-220 TaxID=454133 RepID=UPI001115758B|nr:ATP-binding protein [[Limnothrix rosea] IAM M-220]